MKLFDETPTKEISDDELVEVLVAIGIVIKNLAKKIMIRSIIKGKFGGEKNECCCETKKDCK